VPARVVRGEPAAQGGKESGPSPSRTRERVEGAVPECGRVEERALCLLRAAAGQPLAAAGHTAAAAAAAQFRCSMYPSLVV
jgi:hypothetical protein